MATTGDHNLAIDTWTSSTAQRSVGPVVSDGQAPRAT